MLPIFIWNVHDRFGIDPDGIGEIVFVGGLSIWGASFSVIPPLVMIGVVVGAGGTPAR